MIGKVLSKSSSVFKDGLFHSKTAVVTGGGSGIGLAIAKELAFLGCKVIIASRNEERLKAAVDNIKCCIPDKIRTEESVSYLVCNIKKQEDVQNVVASTLKRLGKLDFLVNNGGGQFFSPAGDITLKGWQTVVDINLTGTFMMCNEAYNRWMKDHGGNIVNIVADVRNGFPMMAHTGAARAGIIALTKTLAVEWAHTGVRVNAIAPGVIHTVKAEKHYGPAGTYIFGESKKEIPLKRCGTPEEVSGLVSFLFSPAAQYITGECVYVDGGKTLVGATLYSVPEHESSHPYKIWDDD